MPVAGTEQAHGPIRQLAFLWHLKTGEDRYRIRPAVCGRGRSLELGLAECRDFRWWKGHKSDSRSAQCRGGQGGHAFKNGVLTVTLPKSAKSHSLVKRIAVKSWTNTRAGGGSIRRRPLASWLPAIRCGERHCLRLLFQANAAITAMRAARNVPSMMKYQ